MKLIISLIVLMSAVTSFAQEVKCTNLSDQFYEDTLVLNLNKMKASYFDNDHWTNLTCVKGLHFITCIGGQLQIAIESTGKAIVFEHKNTIEHSCSIP